MRVAIIGAGLQAKRRAPVINDWDSAEIKIITAEHHDNAKQLADNLGCEAGVGWEGVIDRKDIDAVLIATPFSTHHTIALDAIESGKHVYCEKPTATDTKTALDIYHVCQEHGVKNGVVQDKLWLPGMVKVKPSTWNWFAAPVRELVNPYC